MRGELATFAQTMEKMMDIDTIRFARAHREEDVRAQALRKAPEGVDLQAALQQIAGWQVARRKIPAWAETWLEREQEVDSMVLFPVRLSMEQCSSQAAAEYKRRIVENLDCGRERMTDLTGGLGVDFSFLAPLFAEATYVERNADLCSLARHNMAALSIINSQLSILNSSAEEVLDVLPYQSLIFLDPARRDSAGRKVFLTADCQPDVAALHDTLVERADVVLVKLSPMLDIHDALRSLPATREVHVVEVDGEVKELLLVLRTGASTEPLIVCGDFTFTYTEEDSTNLIPVPYSLFPNHTPLFLYEPSPALMKAGAFRTLAARFGLQQLHRDSHLYIADRPVAEFPGRILEVEGTATMREARRLLDGIDRANIVCRNFPQRPDDLRRRLRLRDGGDRFLYATTLADGTHRLILAHRL